MFCQKCGKKNKDSARFCYNCGNDLTCVEYEEEYDGDDCEEEDNYG
ncbi:MAG: zinc ribbon domain-containing protein, partial [Treponema sp.]|nr:zinc ribbon domain-containing protein [Treponema sp.]